MCGNDSWGVAYGRAQQGMRWRIAGPVRARFAVLALILPLAACAAPSAYMGVSLTPGAADPAIQALARQAMSGDKHAQLALGIAYEEGKGLPADPKKARKLYRAAATASGGTIYVYVPATRKGGKGYVTPVNIGPTVAGLGEAKKKHEELGQKSGKNVNRESNYPFCNGTLNWKDRTSEAYLAPAADREGVTSIKVSSFKLRLSTDKTSELWMSLVVRDNMRFVNMGLIDEHVYVREILEPYYFHRPMDGAVQYFSDTFLSIAAFMLAYRDEAYFAAPEMAYRKEWMSNVLGNAALVRTRVSCLILKKGQVNDVIYFEDINGISSSIALR